MQREAQEEGQTRTKAAIVSQSESDERKEAEVLGLHHLQGRLLAVARSKGHPLTCPCFWLAKGFGHDSGMVQGLWSRVSQAPRLVPTEFTLRFQA